MTKLTWKGEDGAASDTINVGGYKLKAGKAMDVPPELAAVYAFNPFFTVDGAKPGATNDAPPADDAADKKKADAVKSAEADAAEAQHDLDTAPDDASKDAAKRRLDAAKARLDAAKKA